MSDISEAIDQIVTGKLEECFIRCRDKANQRSVRVMTFNEKNRLPKALRGEIGISAINHEGEFLVKVFLKPKTGLMVMRNGEMVPYKKPFDLSTNTELQRQINNMRKDGVEEEEIEKVIENAEKEWEKE